MHGHTVRSARAVRVAPTVPEGTSTRLLQVFCFLLFVFPADTVIKTIGGVGFPAALFAMALLFVYLAAVLFGAHHPLQRATPARGIMVILVLASSVSYVFVPWWNEDVPQHAAADRWMLLVLAAAGVVLLTSEGLRSSDDLLRVIRAAVAGGAFSGFVAGLQFFAGFDIAPLIRTAEPGFTLNGTAFGTQLRGGLTRVAGTSTHPIELGVTSGMLLVLAVWLLMFDVERTMSRRAVPVGFLLIGVTSTVSRSGIIAVALAFIVYAVLLPARQRVWAFAAMPVVTVAVFVSIPGFVRTLSAFATAGNKDSSVSNRTHNYPYISHLVSLHPWFGTGGGTYLAVNLTRVFDNQYLTSAICLGIVGTVCLGLYLLLPVPVALYARTHSADPAMRALLAALAGAALAATVCSATFDSFSFAVFVFVDALVLGSIGACWRIVRDEKTPTPSRHRDRATDALVAIAPPPLAVPAQVGAPPEETHGSGQHPARRPTPRRRDGDRADVGVRGSRRLLRLHPDAVPGGELVPAREPDHAHRPADPG